MLTTVTPAAQLVIIRARGRRPGRRSWRRSRSTWGRRRPDGRRARRRETDHAPRLRHTFHDVARQMGVPDAVVKTVAGRAGSEVVRERAPATHLHDSRGVTVEEMREA